MKPLDVQEEAKTRGMVVEHISPKGPETSRGRTTINIKFETYTNCITSGGGSWMCVKAAVLICRGASDRETGEGVFVGLRVA